MRRPWKSRWCAARRVLAGALAALVSNAPRGCFLVLCGDANDNVEIAGQVLDAETREPLTDVAMGVESFTDRERTQLATPTFTFEGRVRNTYPPPDENGLFRMLLSGPLGPACTLPDRPLTQFPRPDELEVIVARGDCETRYHFDVRDDMVVEVIDHENEPISQVITIKDPILVPPCEETDDMVP